MAAGHRAARPAARPAARHAGQLGRTRLGSVPWEHHTLLTPELFPLNVEKALQPASSFGILTLQVFES